MSIILSVLVLGILIFVHELGHFLVAKWCRVGVVEFAIGFGRKIFTKKVGETSYSIGIVPLGGYVRMVGDDPRALNPERAVDDNSPSAEAKLTGQEVEVPAELLADKSKWFLNKGILPRMAIVFAGPLFNYLFAFLLIFTSVVIYGKSVPVEQARIGDILPDYPAEKAGLKAKDLVKSVDGKPINAWADLARLITESDGRELTLAVERAGTEAGSIQNLEIKLKATQDSPEMALLDGSTGKRSIKIGILQSFDNAPATLAEGITIATFKTWSVTVMTWLGLKGMVMGVISPRNIGGPIFIMGEAAKKAEEGFQAILSFMVFLSISLAVLNLLPIPVLDGGHLLFFLLEAFKGKPISLRTQEYATRIGMALLLLLMVFAIGNDLFRLSQKL